MLKSKFIIDGKAVVEVYDLGNGECVPIGVCQKIRGKVYDTKEDALYDKLLKDLQNGKPLENFRSSKYYKYYLERLAEENPEYLI